MSHFNYFVGVGESRFGCDSCGRSYKHRQHLKYHQRYECGTERQFCCQLCPYQARQKRSLISHMIVKHGTLLQSSWGWDTTSVIQQPVLLSLLLDKYYFYQTTRDCPMTTLFCILQVEIGTGCCWNLLTILYHLRWSSVCLLYNLKFTR